VFARIGPNAVFGAITLLYIALIVIPWRRRAA
jgi:hypothetical protein